ncbi:MarR family winged helix-turn-helix transcriptional regulator [Desulfovibrio inopinatus]|uniref:MarR family winged helix-turn-helix transcriptional regulator n=1 Tax=Desulfovibrio inopinatus TaxID=102109 RepID=UPI000415D609|nr:MarR family transcriptional regulator [Desulfovibrio inopinatus]
MKTEREQFEQMLEVLMKFVDTVNERHAGGVSFGTPYRLYPAEIHTVVAIGQNEGVGLTQLAEQLEISKATLSERIRKLIQKGFVEKRKNPIDQKAVELRLTETGKKAEHHHEFHHAKMYEEFRQYFGEDASRKIALFTRTFNELTGFERSTPDLS